MSVTRTRRKAPDEEMVAAYLRLGAAHARGIGCDLWDFVVRRATTILPRLNKGQQKAYKELVKSPCKDLRGACALAAVLGIDISQLFAELGSKPPAETPT